MIYWNPRSLPTVIIAIFFFAHPLFSQKSNNIHSDFTEIINHLFDSYKSKNFQKILPYTGGSFKEFIIDILSYQGSHNGQVPSGMQDFIIHLKKTNLLGQVIDKKKAVVSVEWILLYTNTPKTYFKLIRQQYYLSKEQSGWKVIDSKKNGESYLAIH